MQLMLLLQLMIRHASLISVSAKNNATVNACTVGYCVNSGYLYRAQSRSKVKYPDIAVRN